ncbi:hypothetical protein F442_03123 [Phytophthora nicotianae P10297]|uniref:Uncharacterized protein n=1 Tax=Phytophthora nicotianae P10297 TaxID=1317064 RepID=W2ZXQ4_PHYNI|nr:hypothetical protein F442_03123 [Phytophthora nicotianae P10297]
MVRVQFGAERSRSSGPGACDRGPGAVRNNTKSKLHRVAIFSNNVGTDWSYGLGSGGTGGGAALEKRVREALYCSRLVVSNKERRATTTSPE